MPKGSASVAPKVSAEEARRFYEAVPVGVVNATSARELAAVLQLTGESDRVLRALAEAAVINHGLLVCSGNPGYWRPASREEAAESIGWKAAQAARMFERVRAEQALLDRLFPATTAAAVDPLSTAGDGLATTGDLVGVDVPLFEDALESEVYTNQVRGKQ